MTPPDPSSPGLFDLASSAPSSTPPSPPPARATSRRPAAVAPQPVIAAPVPPPAPLSPAPKPAGRTFTLTLRALSDDERPVAIRLRLVLKHLLRSMRFECVRIAEDIGGALEQLESDESDGDSC